MSRLHLFNPENDLALAADMPHFTPPKAALLLAESLACLPAWWADGDDMIICSKEDQMWLKGKGAAVRRYDGTVQPDTLAPWGWSKYTRQLFSSNGVTPDLLPSDDEINTYRELSHRRLTATIYAILTNESLPYPLPPEPQEVRDINLIARRIEHGEHLFIKSPWSGSGRGIIDTATTTTAQSLRLAEGVIRRQGSVMVETALDKRADFAMLYDVRAEKIEYKGLSLFFNEAYSTYAGNILGSPDFLKSRLCHYVAPDKIAATQIAIEKALVKTLSGRYEGPVGVDMLIYQDSEGNYGIAPCIEVNLRMTMGRVAHELYTRHLPDRFVGVMQLKHGNDAREESCYLELTPPGHAFRMGVKALSDADIIY